MKVHVRFGCNQGTPSIFEKNTAQNYILSTASGAEMYAEFSIEINSKN